MTAFSRQSSQKEWGALVWELRTVNHRFLDLTIRLPEFLRPLESGVRERLSRQLHRGKVEASLRLSATSEASVQYSFNEEAVKHLADMGNMVRQYFPDARTDLLSILAWPGVLETKTLFQESVNATAVDLLQQAIDDLVKMREREGWQIQLFIQERLTSILVLIDRVAQQMPDLLAAERERLRLRMAELTQDVDPQRLAQEMAILIQKTDVAEELHRLRSHCQAMSESLLQVEPIGRRLDFLSQELNREANTLSSKAIGVTLTQASIEMKVLIEQIREQVQNIE